MRTRTEVEADEVREKLERLQEQGSFPAKPVIRRFEVVPDSDSTGDPALYIWILVDDDTPDRELKNDFVRPIERIAFDAAFQGPYEHWPYISTLRESEYVWGAELE